MVVGGSGARKIPDFDKVSGPAIEFLRAPRWANAAEVSKYLTPVARPPRACILTY